MIESKTLLTQNEIDTLVAFLQQNSDIPIGNVLDQASIDKLIDLVQYNNKNGIYFTKDITESVTITDERAFISDETGNAINTAECVLECEVAENGYFRIFCTSKASGKRYRLTPACLDNKRYIDDDSEWGYAVPSKLLAQLSQLFSIPCTKDTLSFAGKIFAKVMFGDENAQVPDYFKA